MTTQVLYEDTLPGGRHWSLLMRKGHVLRLVDVQGGANVGMLFYNPTMTLERINIPDTLKCQHTFKLTKGHCIYSDMGRIFCSVVDDSVGWHDAVGGTCNRSLIERKWGKRTYQDYRNEYYRNGVDSFLINLAKYGMGKKDLAANINWFSRVFTDADGGLHFDANNSAPGSQVALRFDMDTLVIMHTCPHPMNTAAEYPLAPVQYRIETAPAVADDDYCMNFRPENRRGFMNNELFHLGCGDHCHDH